MVLSIAEILTPALIELDLKSDNETTAIREVAGMLDENPSMIDAAKFYDDVVSREKACATAMGNGVAFPHARTAAVNQIVMAIGRSQKGIRFEQCGQTVHLILLIGTPVEMVREYLGLVGKLARRLKQEHVRQQLMQAATSQEFLSALATEA